MKAHTSEFKNEIKILGRQLNSIILYNSDGVDYELGMNELNSITPHFESSILKSAMRGLEIDSNVEIPKDTVINYQFGVKVRESQENDDGYDYINYGDYIVKDVEKQEDTNSYRIVAYDYMLKSMVDYEALNITYPITIRDYINAICSHLGLTFKNASDTFPNYNRQIQNELYLDSDGKSLGYTFRDVFDELAQVTASTICIDLETNKVELRYITDTEDTIDEEFLKDTNVNFGETFGPINTIVLSRSAGSDNVYKSYPDNLPDDEKIEFKISDNQIMNFNDRADYLPDILNQLYGLEYSIHDFSSTGICYYDICDRYNVIIGENTYSCVMFNDEVDITQGLEENIYTDMPENTTTDYTKADKDDRKVNQIYLIVDKQNGVIESLVENSYNVSDSKSGVGSITLENAYKGQLYQLSIKGQISLLFPQHEDDLYGYALVPSNELVPNNELVPSYPVPYQNEILYPSDQLFTKSSNLLVDDKKYKLDLDFLNYLNNEVCDEFIYDNGTCYIIRRVGIDENGDKYVLEKEVIESRKGIAINVEKDSTISLESFDNAILKATYLLDNAYTDNFTTKVDVQSEIRQTADSINLEVSKKLDSDEFTGANILLEVNKDGSEAKINADKIALEGYTTINGNFKVDEEGNMETINASLNNVNIFGGKLVLYNGNNDGIEIYDSYQNIDKGILLKSNHIIMGRGTSASNITQEIYMNHQYNNDNTISYGQLFLERINISTGYSVGSSTITGYKISHNNNGVVTFESDDNRTYIENLVYRNISQISLKTMKKNISNFYTKGLDLIKNADVYKFNYKEENDKDKEHIGFIIGKNYNTPKEFISNDGKGIDIANVVGILVKAIQEQQEEIENLKKEMEELKNGFSRISK